ncbi:Receptor tyrosine-protein kinase erbB-2 [Acipenser ruthenus]|uniref:Receptor tyrosine-protein kinase erbB-2 n=1 Tax=Acipenser ruthenus TaxID=7906 RepID=A0A444UHW7_ACIRT|nr:Receptor tyrosine-protein kinase erbB-2 [Acipenser ruthenus]
MVLQGRKAGANLSAKETSQQPLPLKEAVTPLAGKGAVTPLPLKEAVTPLAGKGAVTPLAGKGAVTPLAGKGAVTPLAGKEAVTPLPRKEAVTPLAGKGAVTPLAGKGAVTPLALKEAVTPLPLKEAVTPLPLKEAVTPLAGKGAVTPLAGKGPVTPLAGKGAVTPLAGKGAVTPLAGKGAVTPLAGKEAVTPLPLKEAVTPLAGTPKGMQFSDVKETLLCLRGVRALHSLHIWALTINQAVLSVHIAITVGAGGEWSPETQTAEPLCSLGADPPLEEPLELGEEEEEEEEEEGEDREDSSSDRDSEVDTGSLEVCTGTLMKLALPSSLQNQYETLKKLYTGCQVVQGNLEITHLQGALDLDFLKGITEVQGYVLIAETAVDFIPLENLRIIRGTQLYQDTFALAVLKNSRLRELRMSNLTGELGRRGEERGVRGEETDNQ